jgi:hypothetical protein
MAYGNELIAHLGTYEEGDFDYNFLTYDKVSSGDYSLEADVYALRGKSAFCGLVFGRKAADTFHGLILFPGHDADPSKDRIERKGTLVLSSFFGGGASKEWQTVKVDNARPGWHRMRVDVVCTAVDLWFDGEYVVSNEFASTDVLRGSFGLITGKGDCRFRDVKFLARDRSDLGAALDRMLGIERMEAEAKGGARNGRWKGAPTGAGRCRRRGNPRSQPWRSSSPSEP